MRVCQGPQETKVPDGVGVPWESLGRPAHRIRSREELDLRATPVVALLIPQGALNKTLEGVWDRDKGMR